MLHPSKLTDVAAVYVGFIGQRLLREPLFPPNPPQVRCNNLAPVHGPN